MNEEFTPGPWHVEMGAHVLDSNRTRIAEVCDRYDGVNNKLKSSAEANARLIATAPEMLDLLERILRAHASGNNGAYMGEAVLCPIFAEMARDVLNKVKGL